MRLGGRRGRADDRCEGQPLDSRSSNPHTCTAGGCDSPAACVGQKDSQQGAHDANLLVSLLALATGNFSTATIILMQRGAISSDDHNAGLAEASVGSVGNELPTLPKISWANLWRPLRSGRRTCQHLSIVDRTCTGTTLGTLGSLPPAEAFLNGITYGIVCMLSTCQCHVQLTGDSSWGSPAPSSIPMHAEFCLLCCESTAMRAAL
eukprot:364500-Chlamydomonas_euryale.AAC.16